MVDGQNFFGQPVKNNIETYESIRKIITGLGDFCTTSCYLITPTFKKATS